VLLARNESECIGQTVTELRDVVSDADVLVVNDGSMDDTAAVAQRAGAIVLSHPINLGVAAGEATGLLFAFRRGYTRVVRMDGDGQHDPRSVHALIDALDAGADMVVGSRFVGPASYRSVGLRRLGSRFISGMLRVLSGQLITDPTSGFRAFGPRAIAFFSEVHPHDYPEPESVQMAVNRGFKVREVAALMRPRRTGVSSLTPLRSLFYMLKVSFALVLERARAG
jgi:glycosyltransferase involved in cell wall biosynthesis